MIRACLIIVCSCSHRHNMKREAVQLLGVHNYSNVVLFWPAYWHLNGGTCGSGGIFNTSHINVVGK